jgi:hypothetical protein
MANIKEDLHKKISDKYPITTILKINIIKNCTS